MGMTVIVVPGLFVLVPGVLRGNLLECRLQIVIGQARLIFGSCDPRRRAYVEDRDSPGGKP